MSGGQGISGVCKEMVSTFFQFVINFTPLDILLGIPNYDNSNVIMNLNFVILFAKYLIYDCKKNDKSTASLARIFKQKVTLLSRVFDQDVFVQLAMMF